MKVHVIDTEQDLITTFANFFVDQARIYIKSQGQFNVVLSGGSSPKKVYELLASPDFRDKVDWRKVYFFFGDERYVPADDPKNNALMVDNALFKPLHISEDQVFKIDTSLIPTESAEKYMKAIAAHFKGQAIRFDLVLLGLGANAHTASLFPSTEVLREKKVTVRAVYLKEENTYRITMTAPMINQAKNIAFLVFGENKAAAVKQVIKGPRNPEYYPAQLINPWEGSLHWYMDKRAAMFLS